MVTPDNIKQLAREGHITLYPDGCPLMCETCVAAQNESALRTDGLRRLRLKSIPRGLCIQPPIGCGKEITDFTDRLSAQEYTISGLCQACQDELFGGGE